MLENPGISEPIITVGIQAEYDLTVRQVTFLPLGYDVNTAVYRVDTKSAEAYFLKLRRADFQRVTVELHHYLHQLNISAIIPPITTRSGQLFGKLEQHTLILYPFIHGRDGYEVQLESKHWIDLGSTLRQVHAAHLPDSLVCLIPRETYDPAWRDCVRFFQAQVEQNDYDDPVSNKVAIFLKSKCAEITHLVRRAEELGKWLQAHPLDFVLCHSDAHPGNFLIANSGALYLVDWDNPIFAPKERDLMFFGGGMADDMPGGPEEALFYLGYGKTEIDRKALAYYRYERIIQDIAEFCRQLLLTDAGGDDREQAYHYLTSSFEPGSVLEAAVNTDSGEKTESLWDSGG